MAGFGEGQDQVQQDIKDIKTDDMESEEVDIFERVAKFEELQRRRDKHRKDKMMLKGNDLKYNVYLNKMNKMTRMDLGLDIEGYKDYVQNLKIFAAYNRDWEILADDKFETIQGGSHSMFETE